MLNFSKATRAWVLLPVGLVYFGIYYGVFRWAIIRFDIKTPGRELEAVGEEIADITGERGAAFLAALGGAANLASIDACTTRLRLVVRDQALVDEPRLKKLGARGFVRPSPEALQVVLGPIADVVAMEMRNAATHIPPKTLDATSWLAALGGRSNVIEAGAASSRVWLRLLDPARVDEAGLTALGVRMIVRPSSDAMHLLVSGDADPVAQALQPV